MASALFAALASRALDHQQPTTSGRRRLRRLAARLGYLAARRDEKAPGNASEVGLDRPRRQEEQRPNLRV